MSTNSSEPSKVSGEINSMKGTAKDLVGGMTGSESLQNSGKEDHAKGEAEYKAAQTKGYVEGTMDRVEGMVNSVTGFVTGDKTQENSGDMQNEKGKAQQEINKKV